MSLRLRLFLLFGGLVAILIAAQAWWVRTLSRDLSSELSVIAVQVGNSVARILVKPTEDGKLRLDEHQIQIIAEEEVKLSSAGSIETHSNGSPGDRRVKHIVKRFSTPRAESDGHGVNDENDGTTEDEKVLVYRLRGDVDEMDIDFDHHHLVHLDPTSEDLSLSLSGLVERIPIPRQGFTERLDDFSRRLVVGSLALLIFGLLAAAVAAHRVSAPLQRLAEAAREVGSGALGTRLDITTDGEVGEAVAAFNRMSEQLAVHDSQKRRQSAERHLAELGEIARGLAHSLRNPLNALGLSLEELADRPLDAASDDDRGEVATAARRQIQRIDRTLRSFLALSSDHGGTLIEPLDLTALAHDVALEALQDGRGNVRLEVAAADELPAFPGIEPEVRAVLQALVINAVEASPADGLVEIRLGTTGAGRCRVEIADRGSGLPDEVRQRLFTPHATTKAHGSGMGLFLAHRIATSRYGGEVTLINREGGGSVAVLELGPRQRELDDEP